MLREGDGAVLSRFKPEELQIMARMVNWNIQERLPEIAKAGMDLLETGCNIIRDDAKANLWPIVNANWKLHGPYKSGRYAGKIWTSRDNYLEMLKTIRVVRLKDPNRRNIRIYAGNYKTWWALQMEYGRGGWKGGARPFFRKALHNGASKIESLLDKRKL